MCEVLNKCSTMFTRLGWDVSVGEVYKPRKDSKPLTPSFILRYNGKIYGFVEVITGCENPEIFLNKARKSKELLDRVVKKIKPRIFILTNGFGFDFYLLGKLFGTLTVPPTPEEIDILLSE